MEMQKPDAGCLLSFLDSLLAKSDAQNPAWNLEKIRSGKPNSWNYVDGCMIYAILEFYRITGEKSYLCFADDFMGWFVREDGSIQTYREEEYNLDNINAAKNLFTLYDLTGKDRYCAGVETVYRQIRHQPRTNEGGFWHKKIYPNQIWLDGLYMAQPFYMEYETRYHGMRCCLDIVQQFLLARRHLRDEKTGLYYHGYDESRSMYWANPATGCSGNFWMRAIGWLVCALTDTLEKMDEQLYYEYRQLSAMLKELIDALLPYQQGCGMFYQVVDQTDEPGNYLETSGTLLIAYGILKAVRLEILPRRYRAYGESAFYGTIDRHLRRKDSGELTLGGICLVAGLGGAQKRDGSLAYYLSEPVVENEGKGLAPLFMAYSEILRGQKEHKTPGGIL